MVGTHPDTRGGISSVVRGYVNGGLFERFVCQYIPTHRDGNRWRKLTTALHGWARVTVALCTLDAPLVHIHLSSRASFWRKSVVCALAGIARRPYILHLHGSEFMTFFDSECSPRQRRLVKRVFESAALVIALSEEWRANALRIAPASRVEVLANAVSLPHPNPAARAAAPPTVLCLGRVGRRKGSFDLLEAFARLPDNGSVLVLAGDGAIEQVRERAQDLGIGSRVVCPGWLDAAQAAEALSRATTFVLPSYAEGLPMAVLEAMAHGLPIVTTPVGGIPQAIRHGESGLLVQPGDIDALASAIAALLQQPAERERLGAAARQTIVQRFSQGAAIDRLASIYQRFGVPGLNETNHP